MAFAAAAIPVISLAATAVGTAVSAYGAYQQGQAASAAADYQAQVARNNAIIARQNANAAVDAAAAKAQDNDMRTRAMLGEALASQGANGLDVNTGSAVDVRAGTAQVGRTNTLRIVDAGQKEARNYLAQANNFTAQSQRADMESGFAQQQGSMNAFTSIIGGAGNFSDKWMTYKNKGLLPSFGGW